MRAEIISVGTELLAGDVVNTNIAFLSRELSMLGFDVRHQSVVGDDREDIVDALKVAVSRSHLTVFTGGLGPTEDDFTKETVAGALGLKLVMHEPTMAKIKEFFESRSLEMTNNNIKQALVIEDSTVLDNENGTAPGLFIKKGNQAIALLPGPPKELEPLFEKKLKQYLAAMTGKAVASASLHVFGIGESELETKVKDLLYRENPSAALYAKTGEVNINI
ncbi:MAG: molybdopterin-binding protein, partial [Oscillospiraceae bacterium]